MKLAEQSQSTRKQSRSAEERIAKRREKWPIMDGFGPVQVDDLGGSAAVVTHATRGGVYLEYQDETAAFHAVPIEAAAALGFSDPETPSKSTGKPKS